MNFDKLSEINILISFDLI